MRDWIVNNDLKQDQIISISSGLSDLENERHVLVCIYRKESSSNEPALQNLEFDNCAPKKQWDD